MMATYYTGSTSTIGSAVWSEWADDYFTSTGATSTTTYVWHTWASGTSTATSSRPVYSPPSMTEAQAKAYEERRKENLKRVQEAEEKRRVARERAKTLLVRHLNPEQQQCFNRQGHFFVRGRSGAMYRVRQGRTGNVDVLDDKGRLSHKLCAHPNTIVPDFDTMLAQKLALEHDDIEFAKVANRHVAINQGEQILH